VIKKGDLVKGTWIYYGCSCREGPIRPCGRLIGSIYWWKRGAITNKEVSKC